MGESMSEAEARKQRSIGILKARGIPFIQGLPVIESSGEVKLRSAEATAKRAICSLLTIQHVCDLLNNESVEESRRHVIGLLGQYDVAEELTQRERETFGGQLSETDLIQVAWQYEMDWVLLWALGIVEALGYPEDICDCEFSIDAVIKHGTFGDFMKSVRMRDIGEILDEADLIFRYDWACVEARIHGDEAPAGLNPEVVVERHKALNWLIGYGDDWDDLPADT